MKHVILIILLLPFSLNALDLTGYWTIQSSEGNGIISIKDDGTYVGYLPIIGQATEGSYEVLKDGSGVLINDPTGEIPIPLLLDIRQVEKDRVILQMVMAAIVLERSNAKIYSEYEDIIAESLIESRKRKAELEQWRSQAPVVNNLRQIASAGQQYILEEGVSSATYAQLEGIYFEPIEPINGESYTELVVSENGGTLTVTDKDGEVYEYTY